MTVLDREAPDGLRTRGTVIVVPGRGETPATYTRFASRLAADAYRVRVIEAPRLDATAEGGSALEQFAADLDVAAAGATTEGDVVHPLVLIGADSGAVAVSALVAEPRLGSAWWPDAVVLAGLPSTSERGTNSDASTWEEQLDVRTACPAHRSVLSANQPTADHALARPVPTALVEAALASRVDLPRLVLVGDADPLADRAALGTFVGAMSRARLTVVRGARHDVLNDLQHRSVAAEVVTFLEVLRNELEPVLAVESSAW